MTTPVNNDDRDSDSSTVASPGADDDAARLPPGVPRRIGHYAIRSVVASGGMGTVYKAVQENPRRVVAIKIMKAGVASGSALRRFEFESQLLGRLRHPGIAQVYEAGTHEDAGGTLPFFAMEYIPNAKDMLAYAREKKLGTREKIELFARVCDAVHHGHQKGIVHRDLKPSNILINPSGDPKIIDFGVARATDSDLALTVMQTNVGQLIGTVQYMSPEQCEADPDDIDIRSDVYALGVTLYELLCGRVPYQVDKAPLHEATRIIREQNPARPSTVDAKLRGDVETIVLKALEKERDRRYQSAAELARDLRHYLAGEAIHARPASMLYQLRVFARRNKAAIAVLLAMVAIIVTSAVAITAVYFRSVTNELRADAAQRKGDATETYLREILKSFDPTRRGETVGMSEFLDEAGARIDEHFADQPLLEARVRSELAMKYLFLDLLQNTGRLEEHWGSAMGHLNRAMEIRSRELGEEHPETIESIELLGQFLGYGRDPAQSEQLRRQVLDIRMRTLATDAPETLEAASNLASILQSRGKLEEAEGLQREVYDTNRRLHGDEAEATVTSLGKLAAIRQERGDLADAEAMCRQHLETARRIYKSGSRALRDAVAAMASVYVAQGKFEQARDLYRDSLQPDELGIEYWLNGELEVTADAPTLLVYWEPWCPYSQAFVPGVQSLYSTYEEGALQVVGLVSLSQGATSKQADWFIERNHLSFPNAKVDGKVVRHFDGRAVPAALALHNGEVVWIGHPNMISRSFLDGLAGQSVATRP